MLFAAAALSSTVIRSQGNYAEGAVKAAYLYRFTQYVEWPAAPSASFTIAVMDEPDVAEELGKLLPAHLIHELPARVRAIRSIAEVGDAAVLYIGHADDQRVRAAIAAVSQRPILIVTDNPSGLSLGSTINFTKIDNHLRFEISVSSAQRSHMRVSSELLNVAAKVEAKRTP
jgi:YfiR/HmsC-like